MTSTNHRPWDEPWEGVGIPESGFWTDERIRLADDLVPDFLSTDFDSVVRDGLSARYKTKSRVGAEDIPLVIVLNEYHEVMPIQYDNRHLTGAATENAVRYARGEDV